MRSAAAVLRFLLAVLVVLSTLLSPGLAEEVGSTASFAATHNDEHRSGCIEHVSTHPCCQPACAGCVPLTLVNHACPAELRERLVPDAQIEPSSLIPGGIERPPRVDLSV